MVNTLLLCVILFAPLASVLVIWFFCMKSPRMAGLISLLGVLVSLAGSFNIFLESLLNKKLLPYEMSFNWIKLPWIQVDFGFLLDPLSVLMLLVVTGVGSCIFLYSIGYMKGDSSIPRYFAYLSLFAFCMIGIVLSNNLVMLFAFWEGVAVCSYLLIGFWFEKPQAADAGNKAFFVNRLGDFGFLVGILYLWMLSGESTGNRTFLFSRLSLDIPSAVQAGVLSTQAVGLAALLIFCGAAGKSAQFPLYIWLPDAMEGPTPVSALIHAATMVAAGVYLMCRTFFLVEVWGNTLLIIAAVGTLTALLSAILAVVQNDIKRILAYSTVSQLGYMMMGLGLGSSAAAMFHLTTHAFFKALLFLGAGVLIHALHTQDIWKMGGVFKRMPVTGATLIIGALALAGIWPLSGFFSKDAILGLAFEKEPVLFVGGILAAGFTAFYMTRLVWVALLGPSRKSHHADTMPAGGKEAPLVMMLPLIILAFFACIAGFIGIADFLGAHQAHHPPVIVPIIATLAAITAIVLGTLLYAPLATSQDPMRKMPSQLYNVLVKKYYLDDFFLKLAHLFKGVIAALLSRFDWTVIIRSGVNGTAHATGRLGSLVRRAQTGRVQNYALIFSGGVIVLVFVFILMG